MRFIPSSPSETEEMLAAIGVKSIDELFTVIPKEARLSKPLLVPGPLSEQEMEAHFDAIEAQNRPPAHHFLGAGAYDHFIPSVVNAIIGRSEFYTAYTPYQPEVSQGTLEALFEFQTMMRRLLGTDLANASLYEGASAAAEAVLLARRASRKEKVIVARSVHPEYREVIRTYLGGGLTEVGWTESGSVDLEAITKALSDDTACVVVQSPNFFGVVERLEKIKALIGNRKALLVTVVNEPVSLGMLRSPGECGADAVAGEAAGLGLPLSFGGPYVGFLGTRKEFVRDMPGRLIGASIDKTGKRAFVITLATREQHIRRARATSNICTNQTLCAIAATVHLALLGPHGLRELAELNHRMASALRAAVTRKGGAAAVFNGPYFNEFVVKPRRPVRDVMEDAEAAGIVPGLPLGKYYPELQDALLMCATEKSSAEGIEAAANLLGGAR
ncbi:MAG: aminomethyl-transferring glycine dehydrogenase subunit GcvPA [Nitrospirae bacterium]|nr:aminomethyl-transferring glycine dehydrogenase subunit GcvPA [Nitrospirota bacterium]